MAEATRLKKYGIEVIFNSIIYLPNFMKIHRSVQKLLVGHTHTHTHTHTEREREIGYASDLISLLSFLESGRLKI
jgi:hypothetical protein